MTRFSPTGFSGPFLMVGLLFGPSICPPLAAVLYSDSWINGFRLAFLERNSKGRFLSISLSSEEEAGLGTSSRMGEEKGKLGARRIRSWDCESLELGDIKAALRVSPKEKEKNKETCNFNELQPSTRGRRGF